MVSRASIAMLLLSVSLAQANGLEDREIPAMKPEHLKTLRLLHKRNAFKVEHAGLTKAIEPCFVDKEIRSVSTERLAKMLNHGYLEVKQLNNGEFKVQAHTRGEGGGGALGYGAYCVTKGVLWGLVGASAIGAGLATGGAAAGAAGLVAGGAAATGAAAAGAALGAGAAAAVAEGAAVAGTTAVVAAATGAAASAVGAEAAAATAMTAVTSAGGVAGVATAIEAASLTVGAFFGMLPTP